MSTTKLKKNVLRSIKAEGFEVLSTAVHRGHLVFEVAHADGRQQRLVVAGTPKITEVAINNALRDVRRFAREG